MGKMHRKINSPQREVQDALVKRNDCYATRGVSGAKCTNETQFAGRNKVGGSNAGKVRTWINDPMIITRK